MDVVLRRLRAEDIDQVIEIEREAFSPLWISTPFRRDLNNRFACHLVASNSEDAEKAGLSDRYQQNTPHSRWSRLLLAARRLVPNNRTEPVPSCSISGYVSVWYQGDEAHITEIAVREKLRGRGIGELLLIGSLREALGYGAKIMTLEARVSNSVAQRLYEKYGFKTVGVRKGYYSDNREDAVIMTTSPIQGEEYQKMFHDLQETYRGRWREISFLP